jgi:hypothetical protein
VTKPRIGSGARASTADKFQASVGYQEFVDGISELLERGRRAAARSVNGILTATYWEIGRRIVEYEQEGQERAAYGEALLKRLASDLKARFGCGFSDRNLLKMRVFYLGWEISPTASAESMTYPGSTGFPLSWFHYVRLLSVETPVARAFYEAEAIRGGWSVRQLDRQISTRFYERAGRAKDRAGVLARGRKSEPDDLVTPEDEVRDPYLLEFLDLASGAWPCDYQAARTILIKVAKGGGSALGGERAGFGGKARGSNYLIAATELEPSALQDLGDIVPRLLEIKAKTDLAMRIRVEIEIGNGNEPPADAVVQEVNTLLREVDDGLVLE